MLDPGIKRILIGGLGLFVALIIGTFFVQTGRIGFFTQNFLALVVLIVIAIQAYIYSGQWEVMREQSQKVEKSFVLANRASLSVHSIELNKTEHVVLVKIENTGNMPAQGISLYLKLVSFGPVEGIESGDLHQEIRSSSVREDYGRTKLFKGNLPILLTFYLRADWTDNDFRNIEKGKLGLSLIGYVEYGDGFSDKPDQRTEFYFDYQAEISAWSTGPPEHGDVLGWDDEKEG